MTILVVPRAIVYPHKRAKAERSGAGDDDQPVFGATAEPGAGEGAESAEDRFAARLIKYVPAEAVSVFLILSSMPGISDVLLIVVLVAVAAGAVLYQSNRNAKLPKGLRPGWYSNVFTLVAFLAWAAGTSGNVQRLLDIEQVYAAVVMTLVAFLLPAVDERVARAVDK